MRLEIEPQGDVRFATKWRCGYCPAFGDISYFNRCFRSGSGNRADQLSRDERSGTVTSRSGGPERARSGKAKANEGARSIAVGAPRIATCR